MRVWVVSVQTRRVYLTSKSTHQGRQQAAPWYPQAQDFGNPSSAFQGLPQPKPPCPSRAGLFPERLGVRLVGPLGLTGTPAREGGQRLRC